ncbi:hypothetical protein MFRU_015g01390 [Monilinia fructicola]|nr:hypothetical protein MFRU_015g01390 [Monilinia fructicola]
MTSLFGYPVTPESISTSASSTGSPSPGQTPSTHSNPPRNSFEEIISALPRESEWRAFLVGRGNEIYFGDLFREVAERKMYIREDGRVCWRVIALYA